MNVARPAVAGQGEEHTAVEAIERESAGTRPLELTVTDLKQWAYCPRIPYYHHVMPVEIARTWKMERGRDVEAAVQAMEKRRGFRRYGLEGGERRFGVWLHSAVLGLAGKLDLLITTPQACYPVDFKDTEGGVRYNHRIQLAAYALIVEESLGRAVPAAFVYLVPARQLVRVPVGNKEREQVVSAIREMRRIIGEEDMPAPTPVRARCVACEFRNYCADIW
jgi:CRISPR-associated exonuclease Cas4